MDNQKQEAWNRQPDLDRDKQKHGTRTRQRHIYNKTTTTRNGQPEIRNKKKTTQNTRQEMEKQENDTNRSKNKQQQHQLPEMNEIIGDAQLKIINQPRMSNHNCANRTVQLEQKTRNKQPEVDNQK